MFYQLNLLTLIFAPVIAYLAAALIFSMLASKEDDQSLQLNTNNFRYRDGHH